MTLWVVKGGKTGERELRMLEQSVVGIGWEEVPDLMTLSSREQVTDAVREGYPDAKEATVYNYVGQLWAFSRTMQPGDFVVVPLKTRGAITFGEITSSYEYRSDLGPDMLHTRRVKWLRTDIPRTAFDSDLLYTFGSAMTVCRAVRNNAEARTKALALNEPRVATRKPADIGTEPDEAPLDIEQAAKDEVLQFLSSKFRGHDLARLIDAILQGQGMTTKMSPPGPDGGVDILAGSGPLGFEPPRICIQVKSSDSPVDVTVFRSLVGSMQAVSAEYGLLACWGGFKKTVYQEAQNAHFKVRLWDATDILSGIFEYYDKLPATLRTDLPLKRIWALALEERQ